VGTYVAGDASSDTTSPTTLTGVTWPAHSGDDLALLAHAYGDGTNTGTMSATFANLADLTDTNLRAVLGKRIPSVMTGSESGDVSLTTTTGARQVGTLGVWNGYTDVQQVVNQPETSGSAVTTHASPSITPQVTGSGFVLIYMERVTTGTTTITPPAGFTKRLEFGTSGSGGVFVCVADDLSGTRGLTLFTPGSWTGSTATTSAMVYLIELAPSFTTHEASGTRTATATLTASAALTRLASGDTTATATLTASADVVPASSTTTEPRSPFLIEVYDNSFAKLGRVGAYTAARFHLMFNDVSTWSLTLSINDRAAALLEDETAGRRITVDYLGQRILSGPVDQVRTFDEGTGEQLEVSGVDDTFWLKVRAAFPVPGATLPAMGTAFTQTAEYAKYSGNGETVLRSIVSDNAITRLPVPTLALETNQNRGATVNVACRMDTVLERCQYAATNSGLGFRVIQVGSVLKFQVYDPSDQPVRLSRKLGNLEKWERVKTAPAATRVIAGGQGEGTARRFLEYANFGYDAQYGVREHFADARDADNDTDLGFRANDYISENGYPASGFTVTPRDTAAMSFGTHYGLGDKVTIELRNAITTTDVVQQVILTADVENGVDIEPTVGQAAAVDRANAFVREIPRLWRAVQRLQRST